MNREKIIWLLISAALCSGLVLGFSYLDYKPDSEENKLCNPNEHFIAWDELIEIEQVNIKLWGKIPKKNFCPHCGELSLSRFCKHCKKERGNLPFIGVYCSNCDPEGKYASSVDDFTTICGDCGSKRTWKYVYRDWQTSYDPNEEKRK